MSEKNKYEELAEKLVGDDPLNRYTHEELCGEVERLKEVEEEFWQRVNKELGR